MIYKRMFFSSKYLLIDFNTLYIKELVMLIYLSYPYHINKMFKLLVFKLSFTIVMRSKQ